MLKSKYPDVYIPDVALPDLLLQKATEYGNKIALIDGLSGASLTFKQLRAAVLQLAAALHAQGVRHGDVVMICSLNRVEYPLWAVAVTYLGGIFTTANPNYVPDELASLMLASNASYFISDVMAAEKMKTAAKKYGKIKRMFSFGDVLGCVSHSYLMSAKVKPAPKVPLNPNDTAFVPYSSGTSGRSKGVMLSHRNIVANIHQASQKELNAATLGKEVYLCVVPMYHIYGLTVLQCFSCFTGETMVVLPKFDLQHFLAAIQKYKVTVINVVPPIIILLSKHPLLSKYDVSSVHTVYSGAAPLGEEQGKEIMKRLNIRCIKQGYGMTETSPVTHLTPSTDWKHGSVGFIIPNTECKVIDTETGKTLGVMQDGEICVRGPQVMKGYLNNPKATADIIDKEGWLHTGDIGHFDEGEHFFIVDRLKELIKFNGLQVAPADLEGLLLTHPAVADCGVVGIPDAQAGELPGAYVVLKPSHRDTTAEQIQNFVADRVSPHKKLRGGVIFVSEIPKSPSGKILRRLLKENALAAKSKL